ncbi:MAG: ECF-type sigma factor [Acidobacteriota bacterium]
MHAGDHLGDDLTRLLERWGSGDEAAREELMRLLYDQLKTMAHRCMRSERPDHTLQPTEIVHEAYLRLCGVQGLRWESRAQFFAFAAQVMRHILVDHARRRRAAKRSWGVERLSAEMLAEHGRDKTVDVLELERALERLEKIDLRQSRIVELRYFAGMTLEEVASVIGVSSSTVKTDWDMARAWLRRQMRRQDGNSTAR